MGARATYVELAANFNTNSQNAVFLSARAAAKALGVNKGTAGKWLHELEHYGFIALVQGSYLGLDGKGKAARYRLTDCWYAGKEPTYDFQYWMAFCLILKISLYGKPVHGLRKSRT